MIASFADKDTRALANGERVKRFQGIEKIARRKLRLLEAAAQLKDLASPPGNRLEKLKGDRDGQHSIRIDGQWRVCFVWIDNRAHRVEIVDYHD